MTDYCDSWLLLTCVPPLARCCCCHCRPCPRRRRCSDAAATAAEAKLSPCLTPRPPPPPTHVFNAPPPPLLPIHSPPPSLLNGRRTFVPLRSLRPPLHHRRGFLTHWQPRDYRIQPQCALACHQCSRRQVLGGSSGRRSHDHGQRWRAHAAPVGRRQWRVRLLRTRAHARTHARTHTHTHTHTHKHTHTHTHTHTHAHTHTHICMCVCCSPSCPTTCQFQSFSQVLIRQRSRGRSSSQLGLCPEGEQA